MVIGSLKKGASIPVGHAIEISIDGKLTRVMNYHNKENDNLSAVKLSALEIPNEPEAEVDYTIINHTVFRLINSKKLEIKTVEILPTGKSGKQYFILNASNPFMLPWEKPGAYFFDPTGKFLFSLPIGYSETSDGIDFSPNEKYVAQDEGTWVIRDLKIFTFPDLKKMGEIAHLGYSWTKDDFIIFTTVSEPTEHPEKPNCPIDLAAYQYVAMYDIKNDKVTPIKMYDNLTEYSLKKATNDYLILQKTYVTKIEDWANTQLWNHEEVKISNPLQTIETGNIKE